VADLHQLKLLCRALKSGGSARLAAIARPKRLLKTVRETDANFFTEDVQSALLDECMRFDAAMTIANVRTMAMVGSGPVCWTIASTLHNSPVPNVRAVIDGIKPVLYARAAAAERGRHLLRPLDHNPAEALLLRHAGNSVTRTSELVRPADSSELSDLI